METNRETAVGPWVDGQLVGLYPDDDWEPDATRAFERFAESRAAVSAERKKWIRNTAALTAASVLLLTLSGSRIFRIWTTPLSPVVGPAQVSAGMKIVKDGQKAPDFTLPGANGTEVRLSSYKGKVVLLNFWATWCYGCRLEIPWLIQFQNKYKDRGFTVIGVSMDDAGWKVVRPFLAEKQMNYPVVVGTDNVSKRYNIQSLPATFLIGRDGKIAASRVGDVDNTARAAYENEIVRLLPK
ncbi:MAG: TlpA disulfide reductase family protein [Candidatus Acidiferrales bacterium]